jgi:hypothetical protein
MTGFHTSLRESAFLIRKKLEKNPLNLPEAN